MKRLIGITATALFSFTHSALASTSGTLEGNFTVGYSCDMTIPSAATLSVSGPTATGSSVFPYGQNGSTTYTLGSLTLTGPNEATLTGTVSVRDSNGSTIVSNSSEASSATGNLSGNTAGTGSVIFTVDEVSEPSFVNGSYVISSVITCAET